MTTTPPEAPAGPPPAEGPPPGGPRVSGADIKDLGRLRRSATDRKVAGVAGGLGRHLDIDPLVLRVAFVVLVFFGGAGLVLYVACWLLVPSDDSDRAALALDERTRGLALVLAGAVAVLLLLGDTWGDQQWLGWPLVLAGVVALVVMGRRQSPPHAPVDPAVTPPVDPTAASVDPSTTPYAVYQGAGSVRRCFGRCRGHGSSLRLRPPRRHRGNP